MSTEQIRPDEARASLAEVADKRAAVRRADLDRVALVVLGVVQIGYAGLVVVVTGRGIPFSPLFFLASWVPVAAFGVWRDRHERAFSRGGRLVFWTSIAAYLLWFAFLVVLITPRIGWHSRVPNWHDVIVSVVAAVPLFVGAWLIGRGR